MKNLIKKIGLGAVLTGVSIGSFGCGGRFCWGIKNPESRAFEKEMQVSYEKDYELMGQDLKDMRKINRFDEPICPLNIFSYNF